MEYIIIFVALKTDPAQSDGILNIQSDLITYTEMKNKYIDLIDQTFEFPQDEFDVKNGQLHFHGINMMDIIDQYGTPLKISYLPKISSQIQKAKRMFNVAMAKVDYQGSYNYCYCTKSSHFEFVLREAMKNDIHLETSSAFDLNLIEALESEGVVNKDLYIICNGFKKPAYIDNIANFVNAVLTSVITRKKEFAMLQSIGMTGKQLKRMLSFEGLYYAVGTIITSVVLGVLSSVVIVRGISNGIWFFTYQFVIWPMLVIYPFLILLTIAIPALLYRQIAKASIIERLRQ